MKRETNWNVAIADGNLVVDNEGNAIARAMGKNPEEAASRAKAIAAHFQMLAALEDAEDALSLLKQDHPRLGYTSSLERIRAAISAAKG